jgi:hypothetical protein
MSLHPHVIAPVPEETARVARAAFPKGHPYLTFRDALGIIFQDEDFRALFPGLGQPASLNLSHFVARKTWLRSDVSPCRFRSNHVQKGEHFRGRLVLVCTRRSFLQTAIN